MIATFLARKGSVMASVAYTYRNFDDSISHCCGHRCST